MPINTHTDNNDTKDNNTFHKLMTLAVTSKSTAANYKLSVTFIVDNTITVTASLLSLL